MCRNGLLALLFVLLISINLAAGPATRPVTTDAQLTQWVVGLDDRSPAVRAEASAQLMLLRRDDLPRLKAVLEHARPLSAAQVGVLHDVVTHVYLTGEPYDRAQGGFLGMKMVQIYRFGGDPQADGQGVVVESRLAGFGAYRSLLDGDIVQGIVEKPEAVMTGPDAFKAAVGRLPAGTVLNLIVLRQGKQMTIPVTLDARPSQLDGPNGQAMIEPFNDARLKVAEIYWDKEFSRYASDTVSQAR